MDLKEKIRMSDCSEPLGSTEPAQSDAARRQSAIERCCRCALSKSQATLEKGYDEAISMDRGSKLLYGAQVALAAFRPPKETK
jgi:hypothetical protein